MKSRRYTKQIGVWQTAQVADTYGGYTTTETILNTSWARIKTIKPERLTDFGVTDATHAIKVELRNRIDLDYGQEGIFFKYRGKDYTFHSVNPVDYNDIDIVVIAVKI